MDLHILCSFCFLNPILSTSDESDDSHFIDKEPVVMEKLILTHHKTWELTFCL